MITSSGHIRFIGLWAVLFMLAGATAVQAQTSFKISGKACVPDQECKADSITFSDSVLTGVTTRVWDFGDGSTLTKQRDSVVRHVYQTANTYTVRLIRTINGVAQPAVEQKVTINNRPEPFVKWRTDTTICIGSPITLDPYDGSAKPNLTFLWYPKGDTTQSIQVDSSGCYSIEVKNPQTGCTYQDRINVDVCGEKKESQGVKWYSATTPGWTLAGAEDPNPSTMVS